MQLTLITRKLSTNCFNFSLVPNHPVGSPPWLLVDTLSFEDSSAPYAFADALAFPIVELAVTLPRASFIMTAIDAAVLPMELPIAMLQASMKRSYIASLLSR